MRGVEKLGERFATEVSQIRRGADAVKSLSEFIEKETAIMVNSQFKDAEAQTLDKFDKVVLFVQRMSEAEQYVHDDIFELRKSMKDLKELRIEVEKQVLNFDKFIGDEILA